MLISKNNSSWKPLAIFLRPLLIKYLFPVPYWLEYQCGREVIHYYIYEKLDINTELRANIITD